MPGVGLLIDRKQLEDDLIRFLKINSLSGQEDVFASEIFNFMKEKGLSPSTDGFGNIIASVDQGKEKTVILNGHMDTVPGEIKVRKEKDYVYGRGAVDMKAGLLGIIYALSILKKNELKYNIIVNFVRGEESEGPSGTLRIIEKGIDGDFGIVAEPSSLDIFYGQKGRITLIAEIFGKSGHASRPKDGVNAIYQAMNAVEKIKMIKTGFHDAIGAGSISITGIEAGDSSNVIPDKCKIIIDRRLTLGETPEGALKDLNRALKGLDFRAYVRGQGEFSTPFVISKDNDEVQELFQSARKYIDSNFKTSQFTTDASYYNNHGIPSVIFGPGSPDMAHKDGEKINIAEVESFINILVDFLKEN